ncbi:hypothetical protein ACC690_38670, partial [Rhizobium johnstonii]
NDVAKDHPDLVASFIAGHIDGASSERRWLLKHASLTLLKKGHAQALANFGGEMRRQSLQETEADIEMIKAACGDELIDRQQH